MLRHTRPYDRRRDIELHHQKLYTYTCIGVAASLYVFGYWPRLFSNDWLYAPLFLSLFVSVYVGARLWAILVVLLGRLVVRSSDDDDNPEYMRKFSETWLQNEFVLSVFVVTWSVSMTMMIFEMLAPFIDPPTRPGAP